MANRHTLTEGYSPKKKSGWWAAGSPAARYLEAVAQGLPKRLSAQAAGVTDSAVYKWRTAYESIDQESEKLTDSELMLIRFFQSVGDAEIELFAELITTWRAQAGTDWRAAKELLARRFPEDMGDPARRLEVTGADGGPLAITDPGISELVANAKARALAEREG